MRRNAADSETGNPNWNAGGRHIGDVADLLGEIGHDFVDEETRSQWPPKEIGFGKAEVIILLVGPDGNAGAQNVRPNRFRSV